MPIVVALVATMMALVGCTDQGEDFSVQHLGGDSSSSTTTAKVTATPPACPSPSWVRADSDKAGNRWFANGVPAIAEATNPEEARAAAHEWADGVRNDPILLAGAVRYLLDKDVPQAELFDGNGCATQSAIDLVAELEAALSLSAIVPSEAPATGFNSGTDGQQVVGAANAGISGDRRAVLIEAPNGAKIWILARCGNPVTEGKPPVPSGPTDEPEPTTTTTTTIPGGKDHRKSPVSRADPNDSDLRDDPVVPGGGDTQPGVTTTTTSTVPDRGTPGGGKDGSGQPLPSGGNEGISDPEEEPNPPPSDNPPVNTGIDCSKNPDNPVCE